MQGSQRYSLHSEVISSHLAVIDVQKQLVVVHSGRNDLQKRKLERSLSSRHRGEEERRPKALRGLRCGFQTNFSQGCRDHMRGLATN